MFTTLVNCKNVKGMTVPPPAPYVVALIKIFDPLVSMPLIFRTPKSDSAPEHSFAAPRKKAPAYEAVRVSAVVAAVAEIGPGFMYGDNAEVASDVRPKASAVIARASMALLILKLGIKLDPI